MVSQTILEENWNDIRESLKSKWKQLSDNDLRGFKGSADELVQMIQRRTGQARTMIENQLEEVISQGRSFQKQVGQYVSEAASQAGDACGASYDLAARKLRDGYTQASEYAVKNPGAAVAILLGSGILAGLGIAMLMRRK